MYQENASSKDKSAKYQAMYVDLDTPYNTVKFKLNSNLTTENKIEKEIQVQAKAELVCSELPRTAFSQKNKSRLGTTT